MNTRLNVQAFGVNARSCAVDDESKIRPCPKINHQRHAFRPAASRWQFRGVRVHWLLADAGSHRVTHLCSKRYRNNIPACERGETPGVAVYRVSAILRLLDRFNPHEIRARLGKFSKKLQAEAESPPNSVSMSSFQNLSVNLRRLS